MGRHVSDVIDPQPIPRSAEVPVDRAPKRLLAFFGSPGGAHGSAGYPLTATMRIA